VAVDDESDLARAPQDAAHLDALLTRAAGGDRDAFAELYDAVSSRVFALILRVVVDRAQSEEVLQDVFLEVWESASRFAPNRGQAKAWLFTIAHRRAVDRVRSAQAATNRDLRVGLRDQRAGGEDPADQVELMIESRRVVAAMAAIPAAQREALELAYYGGFTQSEIAAITGAALGTVKTRIRDGLSRLRGELR